MAFVNEMISDESIKKYHLEDLELKLFPGYGKRTGVTVFEILKQRQWTVDHNSGMWLRHLEKGHLETDDTDEHIWGFFWQQHLLIFKFRQTGKWDPCDVYGIAENGSLHYELLRIELPRWLKTPEQMRDPRPLPKPYILLPEELKHQLPEILQCIKQALQVYGEFGVVPSTIRHLSVTFDF